MTGIPIRDLVVSALILIGAFFVLVSSLGLLRLPDVYNRMHATTKASTLGITSLLLAAIVYFSVESGHFSTRLVTTLIFLWVTAPVGAHMVARSAYAIGQRPYPGTIRDDLQGNVDHADEVE